MVLSKAEIGAADDCVTEEVDVPEWGGTVRMRSLVLRDREAWEKKVFAAGDIMGMENIRADLCVSCMVDDDGKRLYADDEVDALLDRSALVMERLFKVALRINMMSNDDVEDLAKNLPADQG